VVENKVLVPHSAPFSLADSLVGEEIASVRPLLQKFSRVMYTRNPENGAALISLGMHMYLDHFGNMRIFAAGDGDTPTAVFPYVAGDYSAFNWFRHYAMLFDSMSGSTRYKVFTSARALSVAVGDGALSYDTYPMMATGEILAPTSGIAPFAEPPIPLMNDFTIVEPRDAMSSTEFTIPYYGQVYSQPCRIVATNSSATAAFSNARLNTRIDRITFRDVSAYGTKNTSATNQFVVNMFTAGGPDSKFNTFRRVPALSPRTADSFPSSIESWVD
jgi:hypothetical protein